uniref:DH domain-containing protein n=1 Tax=Meloidogyne javanica TaxID=6303 RepID=A0A915MYU5_MELJA
MIFDSSPAAHHHRPSLQEEIQLALERLKHGGEPSSFISMREEEKVMVVDESQEVMENNKASKTEEENNYQIVLDEQTTTNNHLKKLKEDDFEEQQLSSKFASLYSKLPDQQPLYQIYLLQEQQRINDSLEPIEEFLNIGKKKIGCPESDEQQQHPSSDPTSISRSCSATDSLIIRPLKRERLLGQSIFASQRSLWCELPEVKESGILEQLNEDQRKLQEAYFEVITSEASYLRSISFLISHFMSAPELMGSKNTQSVITSSERKQLFSNILAIRDCSEHLLVELETRLKQGLVLPDICDILCAHFEAQFEPYINYCSNQEYQDRTLKKLRTENGLFNSCIQRLEKDRECHGLDIRSFLMLPMQRITRYPLLIDAILQWLHQDQHQHSLATRALTLANQAVHNCNEGARRMEHTEKMLDIESRLIYKCKDLKRIALVTSGRYVVKSGQLIQLAEKRNGESKTKLALAARSGGMKARPLAFFLFNDLLLITKRRLNGQFVCKDYAYRRFVVFEPLELNNLRVPPGVTSALGSGRNAHLLSCVLFQNARGRQVELLLSAENESDRERWLTAMRPPTYWIKGAN